MSNDSLKRRHEFARALLVITILCGRHSNMLANLTFFDVMFIITSMARNGLLCADVPLRNYSLTHSLTDVFFMYTKDSRNLSLVGE